MSFRHCGFAAALVFSSLALAQSAAAQSYCGARDQIVSVLTDKYKESRQIMGVVGQNGSGVMELFASKQGSWTMLVTMASGQTCIMAAGQGWENAPGPVAGAGI